MIIPRVALLLLLAGLAWLASACSAEPPRTDVEVPVKVQTVVLDQHDVPVVLLEEIQGPRVLPIWIGTAEATSIAAQINEHAPPRPNFHDLAQRLIQGLEAEVLSVVVTELRSGTYYAVMTLSARGRTLEIDVRPSDGIAVALRTQAPIRVRSSVFDAALRGEPEEQTTERAI